jgi:DNA-directed RNA polymerase subunit RPC12/RpoP
MATDDNPPLSPTDEVVGEPSEPPPLPPEDEATRAARAYKFPCGGCGADLAFDPREQAPKCPYCGHVAPAPDSDRAVRENDLLAALEKAAERRAEVARKEDLHEVRCDNCHATVQFQGALTAQRCPYCAQSMAREGVHESTQRLAVDGIVPFQIDDAKARANLAQWVKSRWFLPSVLARKGINAAFQGVYLPFFTFDALTANRYRGMRGEHYYVTVGTGKNRRTERRTRWYPASGSFRRFFDDVLESAGSGLPADELAALAPWPLAGLKPWAPEYLAGYFARTYERSLPDCFADARSQVERELDLEVRRRIGGDVQRVLSIDTDWSALTYKHVLLPVWMASYRWKSKTYRVVVNAATGEVQGERPWSWLKIALLVLLLGGVVAAAAAVAARA